MRPCERQRGSARLFEAAFFAAMDIGFVAAAPWHPTITSPRSRGAVLRSRAAVGAARRAQPGVQPC